MTTETERRVTGDFPDGRPLLVALDIDGTLHAAPEHDPRAHERISPAVRAAVRAVIATGTPVVLCTGRLAPATLPFLRALDITTGFAVCANGAVLIDATGRIREQVTFDLAEPIARLRERMPDAVFVAETPGVGVRATGPVDDADTHHSPVTLVTVEELAATPTTRLAVHWPDGAAPALADLDLPGVRSCRYPGESVADLTAAGVSKASMLERLRLELGVAAEATLAIGDGVNDVEMLAWAAHGIAMGNAPASVRAVADTICPSAAEDGVAIALAPWFPPSL